MAGAQEYILLLSNIRDMVKLPPASAHAYRGVTLAEVRGTIYSVFSLAELLGLPPTPTPELSVAMSRQTLRSTALWSISSLAKWRYW